MKRNRLGPALFRLSVAVGWVSLMFYVTPPVWVGVVLIANLALQVAMLVEAVRCPT